MTASEARLYLLVIGLVIEAAGLVLMTGIARIRTAALGAFLIEVNALWFSAGRHDAFGVGMVLFIMVLTAIVVWLVHKVVR